jgi:hypothetical protein
MNELLVLHGLYIVGLDGPVDLCELAKLIQRQRKYSWA